MTFGFMEDTFSLPLTIKTSGETGLTRDLRSIAKEIGLFAVALAEAVLPAVSYLRNLAAGAGLAAFLLAWYAG
ncbi:MAG TPA: hypothetical protein VFO01_17040 [Trebonia sp.]|nr:hypothetical protein [Trebonia sp.]